MIGIKTQVGEQERLGAGLVASAVGFHGHEDRIDLLERLRVIEPQHPTLRGGTVGVEDTQVERLLAIGASPAPGLEATRALCASLLIEVVGVKDERLPFRIKHAAVGLLGFSRALHVIDLRDVEIARAHQVTNVAVVSQQLLLLIERGFTIMEQMSEIADLCLKRSSSLLVL